MHQKDANGNDIIMRPQTESSQIIDFNIAVNNLISQSQSGGNTNLTADDITDMTGYSKPNIPSSVTNMLSTFYSRTNIRGDMYIFSNNITCAATCFKSKSRSYRLNIHCYSGTSTYSTFNSYLKGTSNSQLNIRLQTM